MKEVLKIANLCRSCAKAKCQMACPLKQNIPLITKLIKNNKIDEAATILFMHNPFGYITSVLCDHEKQCAGNCLFTDVEFQHIENKLSTLYFDKLVNYPPTLETRNIAIIGGGIAGLTLAHSLIKQGIKPTIYEKNKLGGVIINAIPDFRFNKTLFLKHIEAIKQRCNVIDKEINTSNLDELKKYTHIIFTTGAQIEKRSLLNKEVLTGIEVLNEYNLNNLTITNKKIAVVGLGNTACDVARSLKKLGNDVHIIYRRDIGSSPASSKEINALYKEGILIKECLNPVEYCDNILTMRKNDLVSVPGKVRKNIIETNIYEKEHYDYVVEALGSTYDDTLLKNVLEDDYQILEDMRYNKDTRSITINKNKQLISVIGDAYYGAWNIAQAINSALEIVRKHYPTYLFGGSFNPITIAHAKIIQYLSTLGNVIVVPNGDKYNLKDLMSFDHRKEMIEIELNKIKFNKRIMISAFEKSSLYKGSIETLRYYNHPVMVIGDDCLLSLHNWINASNLVQENRFLVITRMHKKEFLEEYLKQQEILSVYKDHFEIVELLDENERQVSSTSFRQDKNQDAISLEVTEYIKNNKLYEV